MLQQIQGLQEQIHCDKGLQSPTSTILATIFVSQSLTDSGRSILLCVPCLLGLAVNHEIRRAHPCQPHLCLSAWIVASSSRCWPSYRENI